MIERIVIVGVILLLILVGMGFFVADWWCGRNKNYEGEGVTSAFGKASMAYFLNGLLNLSLFLVILIGFAIVFFFGYNFYHYFKYNETFFDRIEGNLPIVFQVKDISMWEKGNINDKKEAVIRFGVGSLSIEKPTELYLSFGLGSIVLSGYIVQIILLRKLFHSLSIKKVFVKENVSRLRWLGFAIFAFELALGIFKYLSNQYILSHYEFEGITILFNLNWFRLEIFFIGFAILVIAEVFRCGVEMKEEQDLTV